MAVDWGEHSAVHGAWSAVSHSSTAGISAVLPALPYPWATVQPTQHTATGPDLRRCKGCSLHLLYIQLLHSSPAMFELYRVSFLTVALLIAAPSPTLEVPNTHKHKHKHASTQVHNHIYMLFKTFACLVALMAPVLAAPIPVRRTAIEAAMLEIERDVLPLHLISKRRDVVNPENTASAEPSL